MKCKYKNDILRLRKEDKTYREIVKILGCSIATVCYHCGSGQKQRTLERNRQFRKTLNSILHSKKDNFSSGYLRRTSKGKRVKLKFTAKEFKQKIIDNPFCYLTGRKLDLYDSSSYHCDHVVSICNGGSCELSNMALACKEANRAKHSLSVNDFLSLCKEILTHNGYKVEKLNNI